MNSYAENNFGNSRLFSGLGAAYNFDHFADFITFGLGLSFYYMGSRDISGVETPGITILSPPQDTLNYTFLTKNTTLLLEPKLAYTVLPLQPYILGGIGWARNTMMNFSESTVPGSLAAPSTYPYPDHTQTSIAYEIGVGAQYIVPSVKTNHAILFHIEYRYLNLGQSRLGTAQAQTTNQHITVNNTNNVVDFGITYRL